MFIQLNYCYFKISGGWFTVDEKRPVAFVKLELMEAADMKPSDPNGILVFMKFVYFHS